MADRLDALAVRESNGKSYFTKLGVAFASKDGRGWNVLLDAVPAPTDGQFKLLLREPLEPRHQSARNDRQGTGGNDFADEDRSVPF